jgi:uncharacterized protein (TIRG00374 family)
MKKHSKAIFTVVIGLIVGILLLVFLMKKIPFEQIIEQFRQASFFAVIGFITISIIMMLLQTMRWQVITKSEGMKIPFLNLLSYKIVGFGISFITPAAKVGGEPIRAGLMKKHGVSFHKGLSTIIIDKLMDFSTIGLLFGIAVILAVTTMDFPVTIKLMMGSIALFFAGLIAYIYYQLLHKKNFLLRLFKRLRLNKIKSLTNVEEKLVEFEETIRSFYIHKKKAFMKIVLLSVLNWLSMFIEYKFAILIFGISSISFSAIFLIITMMGIAYLFPIPLALGVLEAGQVSTFNALDLNPLAGFGLSMIIRFRDLAWTFVAFAILAFYGFSLSKAFKKTVEGGVLKPVKNKQP